MASNGSVETASSEAFGFAALRSVARIGIISATIGVALSSPSQTASAQIGSASTQTADPVEVNSVRGTVLNAVTNQPVARALVQAGTQAALTGHDGKFEFSNLTASSTSIRVTKQGFYQSSGEATSETTISAASAADPVEIVLYPEALLTGTVTGVAGEPLPQILVLALRRQEDENGARWVIGGQSNTDADGQFRLPIAAGQYVLETQYAPERPGVHGAILPLMVPLDDGSAAQAAMHVASGSEQHFDLRPEVRPRQNVHIKFDNAENRFVPQIEVHMGNGLSFYTPLRPSDTQGEVVASLPSGTYVLSATVAGGDQTSFGEARVAVADHEVTGVVLRLSKAVTYSAELVTEAASTSDNQPPTIQQLGAYFIRTNAGASLTNQNTYLSQARDSTSGFTLLPGSYRLRAQNSAQWYIRSATLGGTDLLAQDLAVDEGGSALPLRLVVSDQTGSVKATVRLGGHPAAAWVYLLATAPSATPVIRARSGADGSLSHSNVPPGDYRVIALEERNSINLSDPAVMRQYASYVKSISVAAGETADVDLDALPASELKER